MMRGIVERLGKLTSRERFILTLAVIAAVMLLVQWLIILPVRAHLESTGEKIELRKKEITKNEKNVALEGKILPAYEQVVSKVKMSGSEDQRIAEMLHEVEKLGTESQVKLSNVKPSPAKTVDMYRVFAADLEAECDMAKLFTLLYKLQHSGQLFRVETLKIRTNDKDASLLRVSMTITRLVLENTPNEAA